MKRSLIQAALIYTRRMQDIAYTIAAFLKNPRKLGDIARHIDEAIDTKPELIKFIKNSIAAGIKKTPAYFEHRRVLSEKNRMRKDRFLALYSYFEKKETEQTEIRCYRDTLINEKTGNAYVGVNLYFVSTPSHLDEIESYMERIRDVFKFAVSLWTPELEYNETEISVCEAWDAMHSSELSTMERGFVFEIADEMYREWTYSGIWQNRDWDDLRIYAEFPIAAVVMLLKMAEL